MSDTDGGSRLSLLLLTEDSGRDAEEAIRELLERLFRRVDPHASLVEEHWEPALDEHRAAVRGNAWKDASRRDLVSLRQYIAAKLVEEGGFVLFHVDGDRIYRERASSENVAKFDEIIRRAVRIILESPPLTRRERGSVRTDAEVNALLAKLIEVVPFYCVEAWYFQNTEKARELCQKNPKCRGECGDKLDRWAGDRKLLDELTKTKRELCFGAAHNLALARGLPLGEVLDARKSLSDLLTKLRETPGLHDALRAQRPEWARYSSE